MDEVLEDFLLLYIMQLSCIFAFPFSSPKVLSNPDTRAPLSIAIYTLCTTSALLPSPPPFQYLHHLRKPISSPPSTFPSHRIGFSRNTQSNPPTHPPKSSTPFGRSRSLFPYSAIPSARPFPHARNLPLPDSPPGNLILHWRARTRTPRYVGCPSHARSPRIS